MIILDIESSGLDSGRAGIWQIGALELENPKNYFLEEGRIDDDDIIEKEALMVIGKTEAELRDKTKQTQKQLILNYLNWAKNIDERITGGHNIGWDVSFIQNKCIRYDLGSQFREVSGQRSIDLHVIAQEEYRKLNGN
jgi:DNA polymerase III alpha subunit (gram-positive type)